MYKYKKINRSLVIFLLVTFLFLPFSKPKKTEAFVVEAILGIEGVKIVGATILALCGAHFVSEKMAEHEGSKLMEEYGDNLMFKVEAIIGSRYEWKYGADMTYDDWSRWKGDFTLPTDYSKMDLLKQGIDKIKENMPKEDFNVTTTADSVTVDYGSGNNYVKIYRTDSTVPFSINYTSNSGASENFIYESLNVNFDYYVKNETLNINIWARQGKPITTRVLSYDGSYQFTYGPETYNNTFTLPKGLTFKQEETMPYTPGVSQDINADALAEKLPVGDSVNVSNVTSIPVDVGKVTDIPGATTQEKDTSIPGVFENADEGILDWLINLPQNISKWWDSQFVDVPPLDFSPLSVATEKFPFCIPWDFKYLVDTLKTEPKAIHFKLDDIELDVGGGKTFVIQGFDQSIDDVPGISLVRKVSRFFFTVMFVIILFYFSKEYI